MKKLLLIPIFLFIFSAGNLYALTVTVQLNDPLDLIPLAAQTVVEQDIATEIENTLSKYDNMPDLAKGFANANTYASAAGTQRGYQGYDLFVIGIGSMVAIQAPDSDPLFFTKLSDDLDNGDVYAGMGGNPIVVQGGVNLGFLVDGLYMSLKFGKLNFKTGHEYSIWKFDYTVDIGDTKVGYDSNIFGLIFDYQLINSKSIMASAFLWRGLTIESGVIYTSTKMSLYKDLDPLPTFPSSGYTIDVDPSIDFVLNSKSVIIPIEFYTSVRLLYFLNMGFGGGLDFIPYGRTSFSIKSAGTIAVSPVGLDGTASIDASTKDVEPDMFRPKIMANAGLSLGPVYIDFPFTYYFTDNGYSVGISAGMSW